MPVVCLSPFACLGFISVDEAGKVVSDGDAKVTIEGTLEDAEDVDKDDEGQEVIKVYIIKAHSGEEDLGKPVSCMALYFITNIWCLHIYGSFTGGTVDIEDAELDVDETVELVDHSGMPIRQKMVYMSMDEANQSQDDISESCHCQFVMKAFPPSASADTVCSSCLQMWLKSQMRSTWKWWWVVRTLEMLIEHLTTHHSAKTLCLWPGRLLTVSQTHTRLIQKF